MAAKKSMGVTPESKSESKARSGALHSTVVISTMTLLSRITGLLRDMALAQIVGGSALADAFFVAFRIPNFFRRIFAEGAFSSAFIPVFAEFRHQRSQQELRQFLNFTAGWLSFVLLLLTAMGVIFAARIVSLLAPGFAADPEKFQLTTEALQITFPYLLFISLVAMSAGILNSCNRFAVPAITPVLLNLSLLSAVFWLIPLFPNATIGLSWGVFVAGVLQFLLQLPFLYREGLLPRPRLVWNLKSQANGQDGVLKVFRLMLPTILGSSVAQVNLLVSTFLASFLATGSVSWLYYSDRLMEFPLGVFGIAIATAILPRLSAHHSNASRDDFSRLLDWGLRWAVLISLPASVALILLAKPILVTLFQYGEFSGHDVSMASASLTAFALGLLPLVLVKVLAPGFYARQDTRTPMRIGILAVLVNLLSSIALVKVLAHVGLALSTTIAAVVNAALLYLGLHKAGVLTLQGGWGLFLIRLLFATLLMAALLWWGTGTLQQWLQASTIQRITQLGLWVVAGFGSFVLAALAAGIRPGHFREPGS